MLDQEADVALMSAERCTMDTIRRFRLAVPVGEGQAEPRRRRDIDQRRANLNSAIASQ